MAKKILFLISEDWYFLSHRKSLVQFAISNNYKVGLLTNFTKYYKYYKDFNANLYNWKMNRMNNNIYRELKTISVLFKTLKSFKPDIVHAVALKPILFMSFVSLLFPNIKVVYAFAGLGKIVENNHLIINIIKKFFMSYVIWIIKFNNSKIIVQNIYDYNYFFKKGLSNSQINLVMGAGVNTSQFQIKNYNLNDPPIVLLPARLLWTKGVDDFLEVADKINQERVVARFVLVGKPDLGNKDAVPENVILDWVKDNRLEWWGYSDNIIEVFKKIDIILYPSRYGEGIPKVLIEGASCCKPIVTYNVPGCNQIVLNNVNGYIVGKRNINSLCMKLITLLNNPNLRRQFGNNGRNLVIKDFSSAHINKATLEVWKS